MVTTLAEDPAADGRETPVDGRETPIARRLIVVLGMHRSGTSAITRGLQALGVELGTNLFGPDPEINAKGYWEDADLNLFNVSLLAALGRDWHHVRPFPRDFVERLEADGFFPKAVDLLRGKLAGRPIFGFKDPRVALLLPFWQRVFAHCGLRVGYLLAVRNPASVARSLARRDGFDFEKSGLLWLMHCVSMLEGTRAERERTIVDYDILMDSPAREMCRIGAALDLPPIPAELEAYRTEFLDCDLRHSEHAPDDPALCGFGGTLLRDFYGALRGAASGDVALDGEALLGQLERARGELAGSRGRREMLDGLCGSGPGAAAAAVDGAPR